MIRMRIENAKEKVENLIAQLKTFEDADIEHSQTAIELCVLEEVYKWMLEDERHL
jgi:hypothetical protein